MSSYKTSFADQVQSCQHFYKVMSQDAMSVGREQGYGMWQCIVEGLDSRLY